MKKFTILFSALIMLSSFAIWSNSWKNDKPHSQLGFTVTHLGISDVSGNFNDFEATISATKPDFSDATFELTAKVASIDTRVEARNNHLKSPDFFDAEKFPMLMYKSSSLTRTGKDSYKVTGDLTIHGVTKTVTMDLVYRGTIENPMSKKPTAGFSLKGSINRSDFGIGDKFPSMMISNEVAIKADGEFLAN